MANLANLISLACFDELHLRAVYMVSGACWMVWCILEGQWSGLVWEILLWGSSAYKIWEIYRDLKPIKLTEDQELVYSKTFNDLSQRDFLRLFSVCVETSAEKGKVVCKHGQKMEVRTERRGGGWSVATARNYLLINDPTLAPLDPLLPPQR